MEGRVLNILDLKLTLPDTTLHTTPRLPCSRLTLTHFLSLPLPPKNYKASSSAH